MPWGWDKVSYRRQAAGAHECLGGFFVLGARKKDEVRSKKGELGIEKFATANGATGMRAT